jgi:hypothetical protein
MTEPPRLDRTDDFSLVLGGPLFQLFRRSHLTGDALELLYRRILVITLIAWLPLLLLSVIDGSALGGGIKVPFLHAVEMHAKFLLALPILIAAELVVHLRIRPAVKAFLVRGVVPPGEVPRFDAAIASVLRARNSVPLELALVVVVYTLGLWFWRSQTAIEATTWYARPEGGHLNLTPAGYWYIFVSIPIFQFILLRWYLRLFLWFGFLWRVSRLDLNLIPTHPDRAGGLGFLGQSTYAYSPILLAQGVLLSGQIAGRIFEQGASLIDFKVQIVGFVAFFLALVLGPLAVFTPPLAQARRRGLSEYGTLASRYVQGFDEKWVRGGAAKDDEFLGTGDIQSLADLGNSFAVVQEMRLVPFGFRDATRLAAVTAAPLAPLVLTIFSLDDLVTQLLKAIF